MGALFGSLRKEKGLSGSSGKKRALFASLGEKKALIIGNNSYQVDRLQCCLNDAQDISKKLRGVGFAVQLGCDLSYTQMSVMISEFIESIIPGDLVIFFFSGHGYELQKENYLIATDNRIIFNQPTLCKKHAICAQTTLDEIVAKEPFAVIFLLDCCRQQIKPSAGTKGLRQRDDSLNFAPMQTNAGSLIAFACGPNQKALDKAPNNRNSLFTYHLLQRVAEPKLKVEEMMIYVSAGVHEDTGGVLRVHRQSSLSTHEVYFNCNHESEFSSRKSSEHHHVKQDGDDIATTTPSNHSTTSKDTVKPIVAATTGCQDVPPVEKDRRPGEVPAKTTSESLISTPNSPKSWLDLQFTDAKKTTVRKPHELESQMKFPPRREPEVALDLVAGSILGMAIGDALGAHVEFRPHAFLVDQPVTDLSSGGTWGLEKGQFTDDTSMALCLAVSLISRGRLDLYDQMVRYKWWYRHGYMSSTGECFDIGNTTRQAIEEFERRQKQFAETNDIPPDEMDRPHDSNRLEGFDTSCSEEGVAGNGALMRLAPVPLFFHQHAPIAVEYSGRTGRITHGDDKAYDACRYYGALIVAAMKGYTKEQLLDKKFYQRHRSWFGDKDLHRDILEIARGSYEKSEGYDDGIRGGGYIVKALEAALWAFWSTESFREGALAAVNLGDDTDTTAAIYGQLAGCFYGLKKLPKDWVEKVYARKFLLNISRWIIYEGEEWHTRMISVNATLSVSEKRKLSEDELETIASPKQPHHEVSE